MKINRRKLPIYIAAGASFLFSVSLWFFGMKDEGVFVGLWVPSILAFGAYLFAEPSRNE
ncbi:MAG: hypothetical protein HND51_10125 [Chloroflexi bacterium]|nr:hypothetical protein [Chloroflexota bacterium]